MIIKTISYQKSFVIGPYLQEKIGVEIEVEDTDDWDEAFKMAKQMTEVWHKENNPGLYITNSVSGEITMGTPMPTINREAERLEKMIDDVTTLGELEKYKEKAIEYGLYQILVNKYASILNKNK